MSIVLPTATTGVVRLYRAVKLKPVDFALRSALDRRAVTPPIVVQERLEVTPPALVKH